MNKTRPNSRLEMTYTDQEGLVYSAPFRPLFRSGQNIIEIDPAQLVPLPFGSVLHTLPGRRPLYRKNNGNMVIMRKDSFDIETRAAAAFISSGWLRTYLPAWHREPDAPILPLWAYAGVAMQGDDFVVPAIRIDDDPRSDAEFHQNDKELDLLIDKNRSRFPENRLMAQLAHCGTEYRCLCARNFFLQRYEAPLPTSPACNSRCLGCLSEQEEHSGFCESQHRLQFKPTPEEIAEVITTHLEAVDFGVTSFGQGCEGEPLLRAQDLAQAISLARSKTDRGTINLNTNGSNPEGLQHMINAGLDSVRISLCSPDRDRYHLYHRPVNYSFDEIERSVGLALDAGIFVSINLFFMPGFTDCEDEVESLYEFLKRFPVNMIQTRNLNIDPDFFFETMNFQKQPALGIENLVDMLRRDFSSMKLGYYNPPLKQ